jgi:DNA-binding PadR family transcriptional regulator
MRILDVLRDGPMTGAEIAERVRGDLPYDDAYKRTYQALAKMKVRGMVGHEAGVWLAP